MSASTVSITANPAARRRSVVASEKTTNIELLGTTATNEATPPQATAGEKHSKDLSHHSIRGGEKDLAKKSSSVVPNNPNAAVRRGRTKVGATRPEQVQSRWVTIARILAKNLVLFVVLAGLAQLVYRLALKPNLDESGNGNAFVGTHMEFEGRIAEMEAFLKKTAKMMQVQVEVVDRKIDNEIGGLKKEFAEKIEDRSGILKELEAKSENLEKSLSELKSKSVEWLSKEEFEKIYEDLKTARSKEYGGDGEGSLDEIRAYAREMIEREIEPFSAGKGGNWFLKGGRGMVHNNADKMLRPSFGEPGQCFALSGSSGFVQIKLRTGIVPEAVTLEHVAKVMLIMLLLLLLMLLNLFLNYVHLCYFVEFECIMRC